MKLLGIIATLILQFSCGATSGSHLNATDQPVDQEEIVFKEKLFPTAKPGLNDLGVLVTIINTKQGTDYSYKLKVVEVTFASLAPIEIGGSNPPRTYEVKLTELPIGLENKTIRLFQGTLPMQVALIDLSAYDPKLKLDGEHGFLYTFSETIDGVTSRYLKTE